MNLNDATSDWTLLIENTIVPRDQKLQVKFMLLLLREKFMFATWI